MECYIVCVVFVKEKTSYELRISDWSSDVCSSDRRCAPASAKASGWGPVRPTAVPRRCRRAAAAAPWGSRAMSTLLAGLRPLITLDKVRREFPSGEGTIAVLKEIDLTIHAGEMVAIVGPSGSGKSTLMNILGCLDRPSAEIGRAPV